MMAARLRWVADKDSWTVFVLLLARAAQSAAVVGFDIASMWGAVD